jgi:hypothetical protein
MNDHDHPMNESVSNLQELELEMEVQRYRQQPELLAIRDESGNLPIHVECFKRCRAELISTAIELYPECLAEANAKGYLPLHLLLRCFSAPIEIVHKMIDKFSAALAHQDKYGYLPIHYAILYNQSEVLYKCMELYPASLSIANNNGELPLFVLLSKQSSDMDVALLMIEKYPDAVMVKTSGCAPVHTECQTNCRIELLSKCFKLRPESLYLPNRRRMLPLHLCLENVHSSVEVAMLMLDAYPEALRHQDWIGDLPVHIECQYQARFEVVKRCVELYPESLRVTNNLEYLPWHDCLNQYHRRGEGISILKFVLAAYPEGFYYPADDPLIYRTFGHMLSKEPSFHRMLLNLLPTSILTLDDVVIYHHLNWKPRSILLQLLLQIARKIQRLSLLSKQEPSRTLAELDLVQTSNACDRRIYGVMLKILKVSSCLSLPKIGSLALCDGDDLGDNWLRCIMSFV